MGFGATTGSISNHLSGRILRPCFSQQLEVSAEPLHVIGAAPNITFDASLRVGRCHLAWNHNGRVLFIKIYEEAPKARKALSNQREFHRSVGIAGLEDNLPTNIASTGIAR